MDEDIGTPITPEEPQKNNRTLIIVIIVVALLCCCCITVLFLGWTYGDSIIDAFGGLSLSPEIGYLLL